MTVGIRIPAELPAAAETYAKAGIKVFRVRRNKTPYANCARCDRQSSLYVKHRPEDCQCGIPTCHGFHAATTDLDLVRRWWREEPDANIGAPCKLNGWAVIDIDPRNGGRESLQRLEKRVGVLPGTTTQLTGGDGLHILYRSPDFDLPGLLGPGIDFKHNGYILLAPSVHSSGSRYRWAGDGTYMAPEVDWPAALLPRKQRRSPGTSLPRPRHRFPPQERRQQRPGGGRLWTVADLVQHVLDSHEGNRNNAFFFAACRAHELADQSLVDLAEAEMGLLSAASAVGLTDSEARASFDSASTRPADRGWVA
ncbi:bifunctional DNA primase/polymerase [Streptomyces sp. NPDC096205]|uniref:bifunctional DNA primase/polymerase n=1 Tax=Streptomyces sp. NPDC096205 TaxID=3366081 RepID=UPI003811B224